VFWAEPNNPNAVADCAVAPIANITWLDDTTQPAQFKGVGGPGPCGVTGQVVTM
jgi:hypothetical protein